MTKHTFIALPKSTFSRGDDSVFEADSNADYFCTGCQRQISLEQYQTADAMCHACYAKVETTYPVGTVVIEDNDGTATIVVTKEDRTVLTYGTLIPFGDQSADEAALNFADVEDGPNLSAYRNIEGQLVRTSGSGE